MFAAPAEKLKKLQEFPVEEIVQVALPFRFICMFGAVTTPESRPKFPELPRKDKEFEKFVPVMEPLTVSSVPAFGASLFCTTRVLEVAPVIKTEPLKMLLPLVAKIISRPVDESMLMALVMFTPPPIWKVGIAAVWADCKFNGPVPSEFKLVMTSTPVEVNTVPPE